MQTMHLFAGGGGGLLADLILGHRPIVAVEWEPYACQILRERAADGWFPDLSVYDGDVRLFDPSEYAGRVGCIAAGFPCTDLSVAGKQAGLGEGTRSGLYREVLRIADAVRPEYVFLENVSAILSNGLGVVLGDLASRGYDARWVCVRASDVGANHGRDRWWLLARRTDIPLHAEYERIGWLEQQQEGDGEAAKLADTESAGGFGLSIRTTEKSAEYGSDGEDVADRAESRNEQFAGCNGTQRGCWQTEPDMGSMADELPLNLVPGWWEQEPDIGRVTTVSKDRANQLKALGNAQVPLQAAVAFSILMELFA